MAAMDKIFGTENQYNELRDFLRKNAPMLLCRLYEPQKHLPENEERPISNFWDEHNKWLLDNCPLEFVTNRIKEQT